MILIVLAALAAVAIATALMLADGETWPASLFAGLAAGGVTLWGLLAYLGHP
jgi:hypothetical protein